MHTREAAKLQRILQRLLVPFLAAAAVFCLAGPALGLPVLTQTGPRVTTTQPTVTTTIPTVTKLSDNANLEFLQVGTNNAFRLTPSFSPDISDYTASIGSADSFFMGRSEEEHATIKVNGTVVGTHNFSSPEITMSPGPNTVDILVTAQDGHTTRTYTVIVTKKHPNDATLMTLEVLGGGLTPAFDPNVYEYSVNVPGWSSSITLMAQLNDVNAHGKMGHIDLSGEWRLNATFNVYPGTTTPCIVYTSSADGSVSRTYTVKAIKPAYEPKIAFKFVNVDNSTMYVGNSYIFSLRAYDANLPDGANGVDPGTVHFTSSDPKAVLPPDSVMPQGSASFQVGFGTPGTQTLSVTCSGDPSASGTSGPITVKPGFSDHITVSGPASAQAGTPVSFTIKEEDSANNPVAFPSTYHFTSTDPLAVLPADQKVDYGGSVSVTFKTNGPQKLKVFGYQSSKTGSSGTVAVTGGLPQISSTYPVVSQTSRILPVSSILMGGGSADHLAITAPAYTMAGTQMEILVSARDAKNLGVSGYNGTVALSSSDPAADLPGSVSVKNGIAYLKVALYTPGYYTLNAVDRNNPSLCGGTDPILVYSLPTNNQGSSGQNGRPEDSELIFRSFTIGSTGFIDSGSPQGMDVAPMIHKGRTMLPISYVAEPLGAAMDWNQAEQKLTLTQNGRTIEMWCGQGTAMINGAPVSIDASNPEVTPIVVPPGRTMLPLRFIAEQLGCQVTWDQSRQMATVIYPQF